MPYGKSEPWQQLVGLRGTIRCSGLKQQIRVGSRGGHSQHRTGGAPHNPLGDTAAHRVDHVLFDYPQSPRVSLIQYP